MIKILYYFDNNSKFLDIIVYYTEHRYCTTLQTAIFEHTISTYCQGLELCDNGKLESQ